MVLILCVPVLADQQTPSAWAQLDNHVSGSGQQRLAALDSRLESFLRSSVLAVDPGAQVTFSDPNGPGGCDSYTLEDSRTVVVGGLSDARLRILHDQLIQLWTRFGYSVHHNESSQTDASEDTIVVHGFDIEDSTYANTPLFYGGSTPCIDNDAVVSEQHLFRTALLLGMIGMLIFGAIGYFSRTIRPFWVFGFSLACLCALYGIGTTALLYLNRNTL
jgi:hypothetical protein